MPSATDSTRHHRRPLSDRMSVAESVQRQHGSRLDSHSIRITDVEQALADGRVTHATLRAEMTRIGEMARQMRDHIVWGVRIVIGAVVLALLTLIIPG